MFANQPFMRDDTFLGACEGLGKDLGFPPTLLRVALAFPLFFYPVETLGIYLAMAVLVFVTHLVAPNSAPLEAEAASVDAFIEEDRPVELAKAA